MAARTWTGLIDGDVTNVENYDVLEPPSAPSGTDTLTIPTGCDNYPETGVYPATGAVTIDSNGEIKGGTAWPATTSNGTITGGTFSGAVTNPGVINGGIFKSTVHNDGAISGGTFEGAVAAHGAGSAITGGYFLGAITYTAGTLVTGSASTVIAAAADVRNGTGRWTGATGANVGTLGHANPYILIP